MIEHLVNMLKSLGFNVQDLKKEKKKVPLLGMECWRTPWAQESRSTYRSQPITQPCSFLPCQTVKTRWIHEAETPDFLGLLCPFWAAILIRMSRSRLGMKLGGAVVTSSEWNTGLKPQDHIHWVPWNTREGGETGWKSKDILTVITDWGQPGLHETDTDTQKWIFKTTWQMFFWNSP